jgi:hypothetical protein
MNYPVERPRTIDTKTKTETKTCVTNGYIMHVELWYPRKLVIVSQTNRRVMQESLMVRS